MARTKVETVGEAMQIESCVMLGGFDLQFSKEKRMLRLACDALDELIGH